MGGAVDNSVQHCTGAPPSKRGGSLPLLLHLRLGGTGGIGPPQGEGTPRCDPWKAPLPLGGGGPWGGWEQLLSSNPPPTDSVGGKWYLTVGPTPRLLGLGLVTSFGLQVVGYYQG